jgi:hypothetical protein
MARSHAARLHHRTGAQYIPLGEVRQRRLLRPVFVFDGITDTCSAQMLARRLSRLGIEETGGRNAEE